MIFDNMKFTHIIFAGDNTSKLDETIRTSRKLYNIDNIIIVIPEHTDSIFTEKIKEILSIVIICGGKMGIRGIFDLKFIK